MAIGCSTSCPGMSPVTANGSRAKRGAGRGHQNRRKPLSRASENEPRTKGFTLMFLQMLKVTNHQDSIPRRQAKHC